MIDALTEERAHADAVCRVLLYTLETVIRTPPRSPGQLSKLSQRVHRAHLGYLELAALRDATDKQLGSVPCNISTPS